ncbi:OPT oligopeptide transporter protein-domain-containing protein [Lipomyces oligophaga]|uniref:OPT oligopeptide transporter protein-domain-containing protein n=1 Tax=Lipomyces oligophaga TaxID=45792 RepID=UPI0034CF5CBD
MDYEKKEYPSVSVKNIDYDEEGFISKSKVDVNVSTAQRIDDRDIIISRIKESDDLEDILDDDADFIIDKLSGMEHEEAIEVLTYATSYFKGDMNFPLKTMEKIHSLLQGPEAYGLSYELYDLDLRLEASLIKYHSPYPEVRSVCSPIDDPTMQCETFRVYLIAGIWTAFAAFVNNMMYWRQPHFTLSSQVIQLLIHPCGQAYSKIMPNWRIGFGRFKFQLNPGPWTFKEQMLATIIANAGVSVATFIYYMPTMRMQMFYGETWMTYGFNTVMSLSCQLFGLGMAGVLRRWVIYPVKAVWPTILPTLQLNRTLLLPEKGQNINGWTISKYKLFNISLAVSFVYFFLPDYLFTALSTFNWPSWIAPNNNNVAMVMGSKAGVGVNPIATFDWSVINYSYPLIVPFYTILNRYAGTVIGAVIIIIMVYTNYHYTGYFPPNVATIYDRYGSTYNTSRVLTNGYFDVEKYRAYSPPFLSAGNLVLNGSEYALVTFGFLYVVIGEWSTIKEALIGFYKGLKERNSSNFESYRDPVSEMMKKYPEVPDWWFLVILVLSFVFGIIAVKCWDTQLPIGIFFAVMAITIALIFPSMILYAATGYMYTVYLLATLLGGYWVPGSGLACIFTRSFGYGMDEQGETYVGDQKMAHYAKIPPRAVFRGQIVATILQVLVSNASWEMLTNGFPDLCSLTQASKFTCPFAHTLYSQSLILGVVGPTRTFNTLYPVLKWAFLMGVGMVIPCLLLRRFFPKYLHYCQPVLILAGVGRYGSGYNLTYYTPGVFASMAFMYYIRRRYATWWAKYNYILSSGLTAGTAFSGILIFVALQYHPKSLSWWGNNVSSSNVDGENTATAFELPTTGWFGPANGTWM